MNAVAVAYLFLLIAALFFWDLEPRVLCGTEVCSAAAVVKGLFGRSWYLWGALYFAVVALLCLLPKNRLVGAFLAAGAVFHAWLIWYGYRLNGFFCPICVIFAAVEVFLAVLYFALRPGRRALGSPLALSLAGLTICVALVLWLTNPVSGEQRESGPKQNGSAATAELCLKAGAGAAESRYLPVKDEGGNEACLDLRATPALLFAAWCPHCDEALRRAAGSAKEKKLFIVATYLRDEDKDRVKEKLAKDGLEGKGCYYLQFPPKGIEGVPALVWYDEGMKCAVGVDSIEKELRERGLL